MRKIQTMSAMSQQYYMMTKHWASDLEFFKIETAFLRQLLESHFFALCSPKHLEELKMAGKMLMDLDQDQYESDQMIIIQLKRLGLVAKYALFNNEDELTVSQQEIESAMIELNRKYREVKKEIYKIIEKLLEENKFNMLN
ncbi:MAG TPA: hypothetical protein VGC08_00320 [Pedobacter sp.]